MDETAEPRRRQDSFLWGVLRSPIFDVLRGRVVGGHELSEILTEARLPPPLAQLIIRVVNLTRLWPREQLDVARELIAHFRDGLEAGKSPEVLMQTFGEPTRTAKLIRRSKLRCRPVASRWLRRPSQVLGGGLIVFLAFYAFHFARFHWSKAHADLTPLRSIISEANARVEQTPDEDRAWPLYEAITSEMLALCAKLEIGERDAPPGGCIHRHWEAFIDLVEGNGDLLERLRQATQRPKLGVELGLSERWESISLDYLQTVRLLADVLEADARRALNRGEATVVHDDILCLLALGDHTIEGAPFSNCTANGWDIMAKGMHLVGEVLALRPELLGDHQLAQISRRIQALGDAGRFSVSLEADWIRWRTELHNLYTDDGEGGGHFTAEGLEKLGRARLTPFCVVTEPLGSFGHTLAPILVASKRDVDAWARAFFADVERQLGRPLWERELPAGYRWEREIRKRPMEALRYLPLNYLPWLGSVLVGDQVIVQRRDALLAVLALERYFRQHAEWPAALEELVPSLLSEVPRDRFDGQRLRYRIVDGAPILYSVGVDRDDDAGRPFQPESNIVLSWWQTHLRNEAWMSKYYDGDWILWKRNPVR